MLKSDLVPLDRVDWAIILLRGQKVILDADLAALYGVTTARLNEQVKRNLGRFPPDFMFELTRMEYADLRSQDAISRSTSHGGRRHLPRAFTEHGAIMAASVLNSRKAIKVSTLVVRAFVRLRQLLANDRHVATKVAELERRYASHDRQIGTLFDAIRKLMAPPAAPKKRIGFGSEEP